MSAAGRPPELPPAAQEYVDQLVASWPPATPELISDLRLIIWGTPPPLAKTDATADGASGEAAPARRTATASDSGYTDVGPDGLGLLTVDEVAARIRCSARTVRRLISSERKQPGTGLKSVKIGTAVRIAPEDLTAYIAALRGSPVS